MEEIGGLYTLGREEVESRRHLMGYLLNILFLEFVLPTDSYAPKVAPESHSDTIPFHGHLELR